MPKKKRNEAKQSRLNAGSFRGRTKLIRSSFFGCGVNLDLTVKLAIMSMPNMVKATALIVQGNPICGISLETMIGRITPPNDEPEAIVPNAVARFLKNHVPTELIAE